MSSKGRSNFIIFPVGKADHKGNYSGWIVYNRRKKFSEGHTHIPNKESAIAAIDFVVKQKIPTKATRFYLLSLFRICPDDEQYANYRALLQAKIQQFELQAETTIITYK